jgi:hypothetical protein
MISNLSLSKFFNALIETDDTLLLCKQSGIYNGAYGNDLCDWGHPYQRRQWFTYLSYLCIGNKKTKCLIN